MLKVTDLHKSFGGLKAVNGLSFEVKKNAIDGLIGPNGAGKTTAFNCLTGTFPINSGTILFDDQPIMKLGASAIAQVGLVRTYQQNKIFNELSVYDNILIGADRKNKTLSFLDVLGLKGRAERKKSQGVVEEILEFMELGPYQKEDAKNLAHGIQRRLAIATALACRPKMLLLDEPATGMNPEETNDLMRLIRKINDFGITILLIEHDMKLVMNICENITVLSFGEKIAEGKPHEVSSNQAVIEAYLGRGSSS